MREKSNAASCRYQHFDKDFLESGITKPKSLTASEFLRMD